MTILLVLAILIPIGVLVTRQETDVLILASVIIALLGGFSWLIHRMKGGDAHSTRTQLWGRTLTFWWMTAAFLVAVTAHPSVCFVFFAIFCGYGLYEFLSMSGMLAHPDRVGRVLPALSFLPLAAMAALAYDGGAGAFWAPFGQAQLVGVGVLLVDSVALILADRTTGTVRSLGILALGQLFFVSAMGHGFFLLAQGAMTLVLILFLTQVRDLISYWLGKAIARRSTGVFSYFNRKIAPSISPQKAWGVGLIAAVLVAGLAMACVPLFPTYPGGRLDAGTAALVGFSIGIAGLLGDLLFSMLKRDIGVKDSGALFPGGTGAIDRMDSLVLTVPLAYHLIRGLYG